MKIITLDSHYWVPDDVTPRDLAKAVTDQAQRMYDIDKNLADALAVPKIKWSGVSYTVQPNTVSDFLEFSEGRNARTN